MARNVTRNISLTRRTADLGSLLSCLKICAPLDQVVKPPSVDGSQCLRVRIFIQVKYFRSLFLRPLKNGERSAGKIFRALVAQILLRCTKNSKDRSGKRIVELPPIEYFQCPVTLDPPTEQLYDELHTTSARRFRQAVRTSEVGISPYVIPFDRFLLKSTGNMLGLLTRSQYIVSII